MSGQYPPPNPSHPFSRAPHHQRAPALPPWGHSAQSPGMNVVGSPMNFYGPPHMGMPGREPQSWARPKAVDTCPRLANPLYSLQMLRTAESGQRRSTEFQQEETMDLSSHASVPAPVTLRPETSDLLRNGVQPPELNGEVAEPQVQDSAATSVIAPNPLRDTPVNTDTLNCSKDVENIVKKLESAAVPDNVSVSVDHFANLQSSSCVKSDIAVDSTLSESISNLESSVLKTTSSTFDSAILLNSDESVKRNPSNVYCEQQIFHSTTSDIVVKPIEESKPTQIHETSTNNDNNLNNSMPIHPNPQSESHTLINNSSLSLDTDESKLVVAESSADDMFDLSPENSSSSISQEVKPPAGSSVTLTIPVSVPDKSFEALVHSTSIEPVVSKPVVAVAPSAENVEILLESMFLETSSSFPGSNSSIPQSVIVSSGAKLSLETPKFQTELTPLKAEELAQTLAGDSPTETTTQENKKKDEVQDDFMDEIEKKLEMLTECGSTKQLDVVTPVPLSKEKDIVKNAAIKKEKEDELLSNCSTDLQHHPLLCKPESNEMKPKPLVELSTPLPQEESSCSETKVSTDILLPKTEPSTSLLNSDAGTSNNPFIEVESELEKMFAGIVEPAEGSDGTPQPSTSEPKKVVVNKRPVAKRKKANSRRVSDNSLFDGSSGETSPVKKRGRKRVNDSGSERSLKKIKTDSSDSFKKGRVPKDNFSDSASNKVKGPFVHIEGSKESPASVVVVNSGLRVDDDDGADKAGARKKHAIAHRTEGMAHKRAAGVYSSSAMSARYNSDKADLTWVCVFCKRGPHCAGGLGGEPAGDLFGPYRVPATPPHDEVVSPGTVPDRELVDEQKRRGGKYPTSIRATGGAEMFIHKVAKKNKRSQSTDSVEQAGLLAVDGGYEVWLHAQCAEWAPGLCIIGTQVVGLEDAVWAAVRTRCTHCAENGAGIGCVVRSCPMRMHYPCAAVSGWLLDTETFIARCHVHRTRLRPS